MGTVSITTGSGTSVFNDSGFVLNTGGYVSLTTLGTAMSPSTGSTVTGRGGNTVPEPSSLVLLGTGLIGVGSRAWKRFIG